MTVPKVTKANERGFTLVELLVVIGIIAVMAAISLPNIVGFLQASRVRSAQDQVASAIQRARSRAISLNTQWGVSFVIESASVYWVHVEDPQPIVVGAAGRQQLNFPAATAVIGPMSTRYQLDPDVQFAVAAGTCPAGPAGGNQDSIRFDRYGVRTHVPSSRGQCRRPGSARDCPRRTGNPDLRASGRGDHLSGRHPERPVPHGDDCSRRTGEERLMS